MQAQSILHAQAALGEGALWNPELQRLYWVDIEGHALHVFDPATGHDVGFAVGARIGTVVPRPDGHVLVALQTGIHHLNTATGQLRLLANPLTEPSLRFNDGKCDPVGRFWVGTFDLQQRPHAFAPRKRATSAVDCSQLAISLRNWTRPPTATSTTSKA